MWEYTDRRDLCTLERERGDSTQKEELEEGVSRGLGLVGAGHTEGGGLQQKATHTHTHSSGCRWMQWMQRMPVDAVDASGCQCETIPEDQE